MIANDNCIFCKIVKGEIPCYKVYEDDKCLAFLDISNDTFGHTLVVPKIHKENLVKCDTYTLNALISAVKKISEHYIKNCGIDGVNVFNNCNACAGQTIMHLHFHIIPRTTNDNVVFGPIKSDNKAQLTDVLEKLKM